MGKMRNGGGELSICVGREPHRNTGSWGKNCKNKYLGKKVMVKKVRIKVL